MQPCSSFSNLEFTLHIYQFSLQFWFESSPCVITVVCLCNIVCQHQVGGWLEEDIAESHICIAPTTSLSFAPCRRSNENLNELLFPRGEVTEVYLKIWESKKRLICNSSPFSDSDKRGLWETFLVRKGAPSPRLRNGSRTMLILHTTSTPERLPPVGKVV